MALLHSRIRRVFYGNRNPFCGTLGSQYKLHVQQGLNHHFEVYEGELNEHHMYTMPWYKMFNITSQIGDLVGSIEVYVRLSRTAACYIRKFQSLPRKLVLWGIVIDHNVNSQSYLVYSHLISGWRVAHRLRLSFCNWQSRAFFWEWQS